MAGKVQSCRRCQEQGRRAEFEDEVAALRFLDAERCEQSHRFVLEIGGEVVGFGSVKMASEEYEDEVSVFVELPFVFIDRAFRGQGRSHALLEALLDDACGRLTRMIASHARGRPVIVRSSSQPESDAGEVFLRRFEARLFGFACSQGARMTGRTLPLEGSL